MVRRGWTIMRHDQRSDSKHGQSRCDHNTVGMATMRMAMVSRATVRTSVGTPVVLGMARANPNPNPDPNPNPNPNP